MHQEFPLIHRPKLLTIDSAHWANLIKDATSTSSAMRDKAAAFPASLLDRGYVLTLTFHHLEELLSHQRDEVVAARLEYLANLSSIAWLKSQRPPHGLGGITDILAAEAVVQCEGATDLLSVRDAAMQRLIRFGSATDALGDLDVWWVLRPLFRARNASVQTVAAIAPVDFGFGSTLIGDLIKMRFRVPEDTSEVIGIMTQNLRREIAVKGDARIRNPNEVAEKFFDQVKATVPSGEGDIWDFVVRTAEARGVSRDEIRLDMTSNELGDLCTFRQQLHVVADATGLDLYRLRASVKMQLCPHWVLHQASSRHRQVELRRPGSDVNDAYLAALGPYVGRLYVDKRKAENLRRVLSKTPELAGLMGEISKAAHYWEIPTQLDDTAEQRSA
ncbi:hypothetical protein [Brevundimonas sp. R86498]|uniref:hypothetical protein n=1 Tax=Brevundimonas sp. R86498 TaxID=3093845 RepID=UPI0037CAC2D1